MFPDVHFAVNSVRVPRGARMVLYSDGVFDDTGKPDKFIAVCRRPFGGPAGIRMSERRYRACVHLPTDATLMRAPRWGTKVTCLTR